MWCGQCFASLGDQFATASESPEDVSDSTLTVTAHTGGGAELQSTGDPVAIEPPVLASPKPGTWVCTVCELANPLEVEQCTACGTSIFRAFGAVVEETISVDPQQALLRSVMFPGLGHAYAQQGLLGSAVGGLALMSLGFGIGLVASGLGNYGWPLLLQTIGVWVAAAYDAYRLAGGDEPKRMLLRPRVISALVGSVMITVILAATLRGNV